MAGALLAHPWTRSVAATNVLKKNVDRFKLLLEGARLYCASLASLQVRKLEAQQTAIRGHGDIEHRHTPVRCPKMTHKSVGLDVSTPDCC